MFSFIKKQITIQGKKLDIQQLSSGGKRAYINAVSAHPDDHFLHLAIICKHGCDQFRDKQESEILNLLPEDVLIEISTEISNIPDESDGDEIAKNSESALS